MTSDPDIASSNNELDEEQSPLPNSAYAVGDEGSANFSLPPLLLGQLKTRVQEHGQLVEKRSTLSMRMDQQLAAMNNALKTEREANHELANMQVEWEEVTKSVIYYERIDQELSESVTVSTETIGQFGVSDLRQEPQNPSENAPPNPAANQDSGRQRMTVPVTDPVLQSVEFSIYLIHDAIVKSRQNQVGMRDLVAGTLLSLRSKRNTLVQSLGAARRLAEEAKAKAKAKTDTYRQVVEELANTDRDIAARRAQIIGLRSFCDGAMRLCVPTSPRALLERPRDIYESISSDPLPGADEPSTQPSDLAEQPNSEQLPAQSRNVPQPAGLTEHSETVTSPERGPASESAHALGSEPSSSAQTLYSEQPSGTTRTFVSARPSIPASFASEHTGSREPTAPSGQSQSPEPVVLCDDPAQCSASRRRLRWTSYRNPEQEEN